MTQYLMAISIGPVQGFIAAARRTRDFWMGSTILSECAKAGARFVSEHQGTDLERLIFPAPQDSKDLEPWNFDSDGNTPLKEFNATNVILCRVHCDEPRKFAADIELRIVEHWERFVNRTIRPPVEEDLDSETLEIQRSRPHDVFEFFASWVPFSGQDYAAARRNVMRLLNGRKALRDFEPWKGLAGKPKSSLDGARETILKPFEERQLVLRIRAGEHLDLIGLVKRLEFGNDAIRFPSVSRFAVEPWIRGVRKDEKGSELLDEIENQCAQLTTLEALRQRRDHAGEQKEDDLSKYSWWSAFPFEGTPLFVNRHRQDILRQHPHYCDSNAKESRPSQKQVDRWKREEPNIQTCLDKIKKCMEGLKKLGFGEPSPYFALLSADGDWLGRTLSRLSKFDNPALHRAFSAAQTRFAVQVRKYINSPREGAENIPEHEKFHGAVVYAGADDVLAFLPVDECLRCARRLHDLHAEIIKNDLRQYPEALTAIATEPLATLSVGIAIGHHMEPLEDLLEYVRNAEKRAKNPDEGEKNQTERNGLAIAIHARGGAPFIIRGNWNVENALDVRIGDWVKLYQKGLLPIKTAYDLREVALAYKRLWKDQGSQSKALQVDALRVLGRKKGTATENVREDLSGIWERLRQQIRSVQTSQDLLALSRELLAGQWIADTMKQAEPMSQESPISAGTLDKENQ